MPWDIVESLRAPKLLRNQHPEWKHHPAREMMRTLPSKNSLT